MKFGSSFRRRQTFGLVDDDPDPPTGLAQLVGDDFVLRGQARASVDDEQDRIGFVHRLPRLARHLVIDAVNGYRLEAPRVDDEIRPRSDASPAVVSITSDAGLVVHDRITASGEPIE